MTRGAGIHAEAVSVDPRRRSTSAPARGRARLVMVDAGGEPDRPVTGRGESDREAVIAEARRSERQAAVRLQQLIGTGDRELREAVRRLARFDDMLETIRTSLRRAGYLG